jgi:phosphatidylglycerophosphate synthase
MEKSAKDMRSGWVKARDENRELNWQQKLAERTSGVVRLPNVMTGAGVGLTILGAHYAREHKPVAATAAIAVGFAMDMEGVVARHFGIEDPVYGAKIDQVADFMKVPIVAGTLVGQEIMPPAAAVLTYGPKLAGATAGVAAKLTSDVELASSSVGKIAETCRDIVPAAFLVAAAGKKFNQPWVQKVGNALAWTAVGGAALLGTIAAINYTRDARK